MSPRTNVHWGPRTREDRMLAAYLGARLGVAFVEVRIGGQKGLGDWPEDCGVRRIDAVVLPGAGTESRILSYKRNESLFAEEIGKHAVEIIEVKNVLNRSVIGQVIAGRLMFQKDYGVPVERSVVLCGEADSGLKWVCEEVGISVELVDLP